LKNIKKIIGSFPSYMAPRIAAVIEDIIGIKCNAVPNYLSITLTPSKIDITRKILSYRR